MDCCCKCRSRNVQLLSGVSYGDCVDRSCYFLNYGVVEGAIEFVVFWCELIDPVCRRVAGLSDELFLGEVVQLIVEVFVGGYLAENLCHFREEVTNEGGSG